MYEPLLAAAEALDVPIYIHPHLPPESVRKAYYSGLPGSAGTSLSAASWGWHSETAIHVLRLVMSGALDRHPKLKIIIGHMGEGLPFSMWRVDNCNAWIPNRHNYPAKKKIGDYFQDNFHITVSGNFHSQALLNALMVMGSDRIMFSTDWPFENIDHAALWFDDAPIGEADRLKIGRTNALKLFKLKGA